MRPFVHTRVRLFRGVLPWLGCGLFFLCAVAAWTQSSSLESPGGVPAYRQRAQRFLRGRGVPPPVEETLPAGDEVRAHSAAPRATGLNAAWTPLGPNQIASMAYGLVTGRVTAIAIDPGDATGNTVYVGTTGGGVWKSTNAAGSLDKVQFQPLTDTLPVFSANARAVALPSLSIGALSVQPGVGNGAAILAGTGDPNDATDSYFGSGILRSADGGNTWTLTTGSTDGLYGNHSFAGLGTAGFAWSTATTGLVVAAMSQSAEAVLENEPGVNSVLGLYYSTDAGVTWKMATLKDGSQVVQSPLPSGGNNGGNAATAVVWNPVRKEFLAAIRFHGYYASADGVTWTRLAVQPGTGLTTTACPANPQLGGSPNCPVFRGALAVQPQTGDTFALTVDRNNLDQGLWQDVCAASGPGCANANISFGTRIGSGALERGNGDTSIAQGDYDLALAAAPGNGGTTILFAGTVDLYRCAFANGSGPSCLLRNTTNALNGCMAPAKVAPAQHAVAVESLTEPMVFVGNDGGLWRSADGVAETGPACSAGDASHFENLNGALGSLAETVSLAADPENGDFLLVGLGANGTALTGAAASPAPWTQVAAGEGGTVAIDQADPANVYVSTGPGVSLKACAKGAACRAEDFAGVPTIGAEQVSEDASLIDAPFLLDPGRMSSVVIGTCRVWRGPAGDGSAWPGANALSPAFGGAANAACQAGTNPLVRSLGVGGPLSTATTGPNAGSTVLYAGIAGKLDGGGSLAGQVFATMEGGSANAGTPWVQVTGANVTNDAVDGGRFNPGGFDLSSVVADPHDASGQTLYATSMGFTGSGVNAPHVYRTVDGGGHWVNLSSNLPNAPANALAIDPNDANTVYVALDTGVYVASQVTSCATSNCWSPLGTGLPNAPVVQLVASANVATGDGRKGELRAATYGRGIWQIPLLTAVAPAVPALALNPQTLSFGVTAVATESVAQTVTVTNDGTAPLTVTGVTASGDFVESDTCLGTGPIAVGGTCAVSINFLPAAVGARTGLLTVYGNVISGQATVGLSGTGTTPAAIVLDPIAVSFPATSLGMTSAPVNITVSNTGGLVSTLQTPVVSGSDFAITADTCGSSLPSQTGCTVSVVFRPTVAGPRQGTFSVTDSSGKQVASLAGTGTSVATDGLTPLSLSFGPQVLNTTSAAQVVTLSNSGDVPLTLIAAVRTSGDFTVLNGCGNSLNGHSLCAITVAFVPKSVGAQAGSLTVTDQFRTQTVTLNGTGVAPAGVSLSPFAGIAFGVTGVGNVSASQTVTLTNNGGAVLRVDGISVSGDFTILAGTNGCGAMLAAGAACTMQVAFAPAAAGARTGSLTLTDSAAGSPQTLALSGTAVDFTLTADGPASLSVASGGSATFGVLLSSAAGTPGSASFTCAGAPANATCLVVPQSPPLAGTTVVVVTVATGVAPGGASRVPGAWLGVIPVWVFGLGRKRRLGWGLAVLLLGGCGTGRLIPAAGSTGTSSGPVTVTPSGSYSIAVSAASAGLTRTVNLTLVVQ